MNDTINIVGAGLAGLSAAITLAQNGRKCRLISLQQSERAQSVLAEGGINGALNTMGEGDTPADHMQDTLRGGAWLADEDAVRGLTDAAPDILRQLAAWGVPFNNDHGRIIQRNFGGQKHKRTAYAQSSTGKMLMTALIDVARRYEADGLIERMPHHEFVELITPADGSRRCLGLRMRDVYAGGMVDLYGAVIMCCGGLNGLFPGCTTGTTQNTGDAAATLFHQGVEFANLEFIQYHPTTIGIAGKRCLISEAARGEGGRLFVLKDGQRWYFMEEKYPELGNLMPRDVVSREMYDVVRRADCGDQVYLDLTGLQPEIWRDRLSDLREECEYYMAIDPAEEPVPVEPGIHFFMGGIKVDTQHRTNFSYLYAAGECACQYHGANRLGGNSTLAAIYGGRVAAQEAIAGDVGERSTDAVKATNHAANVSVDTGESGAITLKLRDTLLSGLGITRDEVGINEALTRLNAMLNDNSLSERDLNRMRLGRAMLLSALSRRESRGAHRRSDYPDTNPEYRARTVARWNGANVDIEFRPIAGGVYENQV